MSSRMTPPDATPRSRMAGGAYWAMMRRIVAVAGSINVAWVALFAWLGVPALAALSVVSVVVYCTAYRAIGLRRNRLAVALIWGEVLVHAALGSLLLGWDSGFHYFLLMFIPAIVVGVAQRRALPLVVALMAFYGLLRAACLHWGALAPLPDWALHVVYAINLAMIFGMLTAMTAYYRATVLRAEKKLLRAATTDPLTGLANRSQFHLRALTELSHGQRRREPAALVLADIDYFKQINDRYGHEAGDKVLVRLAELMRQSLRDVDVLARWGGEEFLALLPANDGTTAAQVAERMREAVANVHIDVGGQLIQVTMSFGISEVHDHRDLQDATVRADQALYASKRSGRNRVSLAEAARQAEPAAARYPSGPQPGSIAAASAQQTLAPSVS